jgi:WS/DGAT/MGAT family acyltransferase
VSDVHYERLSQLDHSFLIYEGPSSPMHVGATQILEAAPLRGPDGFIDLERIEDYVRSRIHRVPRYRQHLAWTPLERHPIWVDDPRFDVRYHLRHTRLPRPGSERLLKRTAGRILSQHLDRGRPLWEAWLIEGLEDDRVALVWKTHHCMVDGISGVDLLSVLLTPEPLEKLEPPRAWVPRPAPGTLRLVRDRVGSALRAPLGAAESAWELLRDPSGTSRHLGARLGALGHVLSLGTGAPSQTPLNQPVGPYRRVDWLRMDLRRLRAVARKLGGSVNDAVLATVAGGVRRFLKNSRQEDVDGLDFRVMAPVSLREAGERGKLGNRVSAWFVRLPIGERDPLRRFEEVHRTTGALRESKAALAGDTLTRVTEWTGPGLLTLGSRLANLGMPFHMVVTNVPGPREPLYLLGSRLLEMHPVVPLAGTLGAGIALLSYQDTLSWGFAADWDLVPDLHELALAVDHSFRRLCDAAGVGA